MKRFLPILLLAAVISCGKAIDTQKIAALSAEQCLLMEKSLTDGTMPKTFQGDTLVTSNLNWWCSGFYPGVCWYTYLINGDSAIRDLAFRQTAKLLDLDQVSWDHDIGFQMMASVAKAYEETGDSLYLNTLKDAAGRLAARFNPTVGCIRSWNGDKFTYPVIIDNMMNLELLTYASALCNVPEWKEIAISHARTTMKNHFREDHSSYHLVDYNPEDGSVIRKQTVQGYADDSAWSRGQAWGLYGFTMMYRETGEEDFLQQAQAIAEFLLPLSRERAIPAWDYNAPAESVAQDDASAAAIMASALFELADLAPSPASVTYRLRAEFILEELCKDKYLCAPGECCGFLLKHSTGHYKAGKEVDVPLTYADYYFMEALYRYSAREK